MKYSFLISICIAAALLIFSSIAFAQKPGSCLVNGQNWCGKQNVPTPDYGCYCDTKQYNDYCQDFDTVCGNLQTAQTSASISANCQNKQGSCVGKCGQYIASDKCGCDDQCSKFGDCYSDYQSVCKGASKGKEKILKI